MTSSEDLKRNPTLLEAWENLRAVFTVAKDPPDLEKAHTKDIWTVTEAGLQYLQEYDDLPKAT